MNNVKLQLKFTFKRPKNVQDLKSTFFSHRYVVGSVFSTDRATRKVPLHCKVYNHHNFLLIFLSFVKHKNVNIF